MKDAAEVSLNAEIKDFDRQSKGSRIRKRIGE
ncbi:hypothetical protein SDC9_174558 [bioreactor metagenome]|uniref:Uncharacterized protein n=1 Tax=bioreactor metagenome TaxID=1076179 RepID=A0A645GJI6_9ZZZZ